MFLFWFFFEFIRFSQSTHTNRSWKISFAALKKLSGFRYFDFISRIYPDINLFSNVQGSSHCTQIGEQLSRFP